MNAQIGSFSMGGASIAEIDAALAAGTLTAGTPTTASIPLSWAAPTGGDGFPWYQVQRAPDVAGSPGAFANIGSPITDTSYTDTGLPASTKYWYQIVVSDSGGSATSNQVSATTAAYHPAVVGDIKTRLPALSHLPHIHHI